MPKARTLTKQRLNQALQTCRSQRERAMFLLSARAGLRAKEIAGLLWSQLDFEERVMMLTVTKGDKPRSVPMAQDLRDALLELRAVTKASQELVFVNTHQRPGEPLSANAVASWFSNLYIHRLGWDGYSSHSGRRTFVTNVARKITEAGGSMKDVQAMAGHSDIRTTAGYIDEDEDAQRKVVDMI